jgi:hypothetical protein
MKEPHVPFLRGLTVQLFATTVLPLTLLLLVIAFGNVYLHEQDMRALIGERDERAVQAAAISVGTESDAGPRHPCEGEYVVFLFWRIHPQYLDA